MNKKTKTTNAGEAPRYEGANWDPEVRYASRGDGTTKRKVKTKGVRRIDIPGEACGEIAMLLRQGFAVHLHDAGTGGALVRFYPVALTDGKSMRVAAQALRPFTEVIRDKRPVLMHGGEVRSACEFRAFAAGLKAKAVAAQVTPDSMVECPRCGFSFRVGRRLAG